MIDKGRIRRIEKRLRPYIIQGIRRKVDHYLSYFRYTLSHHYVENPDDPDREIFDGGVFEDWDSAIDQKIIEAVKLGSGLSRDLVEKVRQGGEEKTNCVQVIDFSEGVFIVCSKKDWKNIDDESKCGKCGGLRRVFEMCTLDDYIDRKRTGIPTPMGLPSWASIPAVWTHVIRPLTEGDYFRHAKWKGK